MVIAERFRFNRRSQHEGESVAAFAVELKRLASSCEFGPFLEEALRDRFLAGLKDQPTQAELLKKSTLTFATACDIAKSVELARAETRKFQPATRQPEEVHDVRHTYRAMPAARASAKPAAAADGAEHPIETPDCFRCGGSSHDTRSCPFRKYKCHLCKRMGHLSRVCKAASSRAVRAVDDVRDNLETMNGEDELVLHNIFACDSSHPSYTVNVKVAGRNVRMQIDTGASVSIVPESVFVKYWPDLALESCRIRLRTYGGVPLQTVGRVKVPVEHHGQAVTLPLVVVRTPQKCETVLMGRDWLEALKLDWLSVCGFSVDKVAQLVEKFLEVFEPELGLIKGTPVKLLLKEGSTPVFCKHRAVPFAMRDGVSKELQALVGAGVLLPVQRSDWATPLVVVYKPNGEVRICGDYKMTVNQSLRTDHYPLPVMKDIFATLHGCKYFTVLDLSTAYQQLELDPDSQSLVTMNTHLGLFQYTRLPYGITSAPSIFQAVMDDLLKGLDRVSCYINDVLIAGETFEECYQKVESVLARFKEHGIKLKKEKCKFFETSLTYLGHVIDGKGIRPSDVKIAAIKKAPAPKNKQELRAYLGLLNFYGKFVPNLSAELKPLYDLLRDSTKWKWTAEAERVFQTSKGWLTQNTVLAHYDPPKDLGLVCDASAYVVGAILFHKEGPVERPIAFASRILSKSEQAYARI